MYFQPLFNTLAATLTPAFLGGLLPHFFLWGFGACSSGRNDTKLVCNAGHEASASQSFEQCAGLAGEAKERRGGESKFTRAAGSSQE